MVCRLFGVSDDWGFGSGFGWLMEFSIVACFSRRVKWRKDSKALSFFFLFFFFFFFLISSLKFHIAVFVVCPDLRLLCYIVTQVLPLAFTSY